VKLEITEAAIADIRSIREYTVLQWGERQDEIYSDRLWRRFEEILADSSSYRFRHDLFPGCQLASEGRHVILFRVRDGVLQVVRVLHSAMEFKRHVGGLPEE
jgi:toxin ParE1/3/4